MLFPDIRRAKAGGESWVFLQGSPVMGITWMLRHLLTSALHHVHPPPACLTFKKDFRRRGLKFHKGFESKCLSPNKNPLVSGPI